MRFVEESGLWTTGSLPAAAPLTAVVEISGAVLSWTVDDPAAGVHIAFTDLSRADWLWRIVGESGHSAIVSALDTAEERGPLDVEGVTVDEVALDPLRRLAFGHWLRRWWPASSRDGIVELDAPVLDGELALLTASAETFFSDDTLDSDVAELLRPHTVTLEALAGLGDPRIAALAGACAELAEDVGVGSDVPVPVPVPAGQSVSRDDYALVAGAGGRHAAEAIATGVASLHWAAVPPGVFDAAENTVAWRIEGDGASATAVVRTELAGSGPAAGIAVRLRSGEIGGAGALDSSGTATIALLDAEREPVTETAAWNRDWRETTVTVGADVGEEPQVRDRVRAAARTRLRALGTDAFLAEVLAAESDY